jgi:hypothetical protein
MQKSFLATLLILTLITACAPEPGPVFVPPTQETPTSPPPTPIPPTATPTRGLWISPQVPAELRQAAEDAGQNFGLVLVSEREAGDLKLEPAAEEEQIISTWVYALVTAFPTVRDGVTFAELQAAWSGNGQVLIMAETTYSIMQSIFGGEAGPGVVRIVSIQDTEYALWSQRDAWAIIPFEFITPKMKVLEIDGQTPIRRIFDESEYPLGVGFTLSGGELDLPVGNRDPDKMATVMMTGTTALVRATAYKMEQHSNIYPARDIIDWFNESDIVHVSNEIPFAPGCPYPNPGQIRLIFCSDPKYIELLEYIGTDVVELTGNHFQDWGSDATRHTLDMYDERGWPYFGGGRDLADSQKAAIIERGGMSFAFIGCNPVGPEFAWAREDNWPGAAPCGDGWPGKPRGGHGYEWVEEEIARLKAEGHIVLATFQYFEYYSPEARPWQERDFRRIAEAGAVAINGSQAHYPQVMEFYGDSFIHYGLGNLFFDQMGYDNPSSGIRTTKTRWGFITRYVFYDGRLASIELLTTMLEDFSKPRPMTPEERQLFLEEYFRESGW